MTTAPTPANIPAGEKEHAGECACVDLCEALCDALDESLTQQEGWINRYCHPFHRKEHMADIRQKREILRRVVEQIRTIKEQL